MVIEVEIKAKLLLESIRMIDESKSCSKPQSARLIEPLVRELSELFKNWKIEDINNE